ncbi:MAG: nicotinamide riboside transporter PnuC [Bacteroidales bacterium]
MDNSIFIEVFGAVTGLIYVLLEIRQKRAMWIVGGISALTYILIFLNAGLIAATGLQLYYLAMSIYGWKNWGGSGNDKNDGEPTVSKMAGKIFITSILSSIAGYLLLSLVLDVYGRDPMPEVDSAIAVMSMLATWWVTRKYIENWFLWIIADGLAVYLYVSQELYATAALYFVYIIASVAGYLHWRKFA